MRLQPGSKLVMIGDSITDAGRARPVGEGLGEAALGRGYVAHVAGLLGAVYPQHNIRVVNMGAGGNTVRDLKTRWQTDVLDLAPDWLSIMIGTNDVWRQFDSPLQQHGHVYPEEYAATLEDLVTHTLPHLKGLVLMTPFYIEPNPADAMRAQMDRYSAIVRDIAARHDTLFVDTQAAFDTVLQTVYPATLAWDRVHPNHVGHTLIARAFLQSIDFAW